MHIAHLKKNVGPLCLAFSQLDSEVAVFALMRDVMTEGEMIEFAQRFDIAQRLVKKESYKKIEEATGASSTTIARVSKYLKGEFGGYRKVLGL